ncbi:phage tail protein, partial [Patescibacteria group bacterium]|nr:phage tail protein [Patescibacteria group bacterium]
MANSLFLSPVYDQQQTATQTLSDLFKYTNAYAYYSEDQLKVVPLGDVSVTGNGVTYTPDVTPVVDLGTNDFIVTGNGPSITIDRKAPQDNLNLVRVEFTDGSNTFHTGAVVASIDEDMIANGARSDNSVTVNGCMSASVARFIAQNMVQRAYYVRNQYTFKLSWRYCYLEPCDIVTLTDSSLGLSLYPVRILSVEEDAESGLTITAEEFPEGIGHSAIYNTQPNGGTNVDPGADPGPVNAPYLFRGPGFLVNNSTPEIWCAVNGSNALWAACDVYLSHDGTSYTYVGTVASQARYGALTTALPIGAVDPDTTNTPTVQLYAPGELLGGSSTDADNFVTLSMVDTEIVAYETATLVSANKYTLGYLRRGGYGSSNASHSIGAPFVRLDDSIFRIPVDPSLIGQTVYLKFLSLNAFGQTPRTLADETAYTYVVGTNVELPDVPATPYSFAVLPVAD